MQQNEKLQTLGIEDIKTKIYEIRGLKVMLDKDLAELYHISTGNLNKAVKRNLERFPEDFMFRLSDEENKNLIFQNGNSSLVLVEIVYNRKSPSRPIYKGLTDFFTSRIIQ